MSQSVAKPFSPDDSVGGAREFEAIVSRMIGKAYTVTLVKVVEVQPGATGPVGFLSATDLIQQADGNNEGIPNEPMPKLPYFRLQGGANAVIIDPKPGDIGLAVFARRDISEIKRSKTEGVPPSLRQNSPSDGLYIGGILNGAPSQWIHFLDSGIDVVATGKISYTTPAEYEINASSFKVTAGTADIIAATNIDGAVTTTQTLAVAGATTVAALTSAAGVAANGGAITVQGIVDTFNSHTHPVSGNSTSAPNQQI